MSAELSLTITASYTKNSVTLAKSFSGSVSVSGSYAIMNQASIGTSDETLDLGDVGTPGYLILKNKDATNYVIIGPDGTNYGDRLKPGEFMVKRVNGAAIHIKANTAACDVEYLLLPD
jgi:hypothetical protein